MENYSNFSSVNMCKRNVLQAFNDIQQTWIKIDFSEMKGKSMIVQWCGQIIVPNGRIRSAWNDSLKDLVFCHQMALWQKFLIVPILIVKSKAKIQRTVATRRIVNKSLLRFQQKNNTHPSFSRNFNKIKLPLNKTVIKIFLKKNCQLNT